VKEWREIASLAEVEREGRAVARVGGREVGVVAVDGGLYGVRNRCPHHGGPLCLGTVRRRERGTPGRYEQSDELVLRCPWHGWEFDLESGRCLDEPALRAAVYDVRVVDGHVQILA
jgi:nitrite reductase/ring-hydroxylating ferredoxin subunit